MAGSRVRVLVPLAVAAIVAALLSGTAGAASERVPDPAGLPAPFSSWQVSVQPAPGRDGVLEVDFTSPVLGQRVENEVVLPTRYDPQGAPSPVLYNLHGTVLPQADLPVTKPVSSVTRRLNVGLFATQELTWGGGEVQTRLQHFASQRDRARFLVASPDTGSPNFCQSCLWINGRQDALPNLPPVTAQTVQAETYLYQEFIPLIQQLFNTRTDAAGRGITGFSMGGWAAWLQALRHPDRFRFLAPISGPFDVLNDPKLGAAQAAIGFLRDQGYGTSVTNRTQHQRFNPEFLIDNLAGADTSIVVSAGEGCVGPQETVTAPTCRHYPAALNPGGAAAEILVRDNSDHYMVPALAKAGVEATQVRIPGVHGGNNARVYADHIVPLANKAFAQPRNPSQEFSYTSADHQFNVWGYRVNTGHPYANEFLTLKHARHDARAFTLQGDGDVSVQTPKAFTAGDSYEVTVTRPNGATNQQTVTASPNGRVQLTVNLGTTHTRRDITIAPTGPVR